MYNTVERLDVLMRKPKHKQGTVKFDADSVERTFVPLTREDINQFCNLGLMNSLRQNTATVSSAKKSQAGLALDNPPSFYDEDMRKWGEKFAKSVKQRE